MTNVQKEEIESNGKTAIELVASELLPKLTAGVTAILDAKRKKQKDEADKLKKEFKKKIEENVKKAKSEVVKQLTKDIIDLKALNAVNGAIAELAYAVGHISIFDINLIDKFKKESKCLNGKRGIILKFSSALDLLKKEVPKLEKLQPLLIGTSTGVASELSGKLGLIIKDINNINSTFSQCKKPTVSSTNQELDDCLDQIKSLIIIISALQRGTYEVSKGAYTVINNYVIQMENYKKKVYNIKVS